MKNIFSFSGYYPPFPPPFIVPSAKNIFFLHIFSSFFSFVDLRWAQLYVSLVHFHLSKPFFSQYKGSKKIPLEMEVAPRYTCLHCWQCDTVYTVESVDMVHYRHGLHYWYGLHYSHDLGKESNNQNGKGLRILDCGWALLFNFVSSDLIGGKTMEVIWAPIGGNIVGASVPNQVFWAFN